MITSGLDRQAIGCGQEINTGVSTATREKKHVLHNIKGYGSVFIINGPGSSSSKKFGSESRS
jgi:hypothetical protein